METFTTVQGLGTCRAGPQGAGRREQAAGQKPGLSMHRAQGWGEAASAGERAGTQGRTPKPSCAQRSAQGPQVEAQCPGCRWTENVRPSQAPSTVLLPTLRTAGHSRVSLGCACAERGHLRRLQRNGRGAQVPGNAKAGPALRSAAPALGARRVSYPLPVLTRPAAPRAHELTSAAGARAARPSLGPRGGVGKAGAGDRGQASSGKATFHTAAVALSRNAGRRCRAGLCPARLRSRWMRALPRLAVSASPFDLFH